LLLRKVSGFLWRRDLLLIALALSAGVGIGIAYKDQNPASSNVLCAFEYGGKFFIPEMQEN
jgi:hypothetical protein